MLKGNAKLRVIFTGAETRYGEIAQSAMLGTHARTPLQTAVNNLVAVLLGAAAVICLGLAWVRWEQGHGLLDALLLIRPLNSFKRHILHTGHGNKR